MVCECLEDMQEVKDSPARQFKHIACAMQI